MTNHDLTIWMIFGSASFVAFMVTLWLLLKANRKAAKVVAHQKKTFAQLLEAENARDLWQSRHERLNSDYRDMCDCYGSQTAAFVDYKRSVAPLVQWVGQAAKARMN